MRVKREPKFDGCIETGFIITVFVIPAFLAFIFIFIAIDNSYLTYTSSFLRHISRSSFYGSIVSTLLLFGAIYLCGFIFGRHSIRKELFAILRDDKMKPLSDYLLVPFSMDIKAAERRKENSYWLRSDYSDNRFLLILPSERGRINLSEANNWLSMWWAINKNEITTSRVLTGLTLTLLTALIIKNYWLLSRGQENYILPHLLIDFVSTLICLTLGSRLGKEIFKRNVSCDWQGKLIYAVGTYVCVSVLSNRYVVICPWSKTYDSLKVDAEKVFNTFQENEISELALRNQGG